MTWYEQAACKGTDQAIWFPASNVEALRVYPQARAICDACPSKQPCLEAALEEERSFGIFSGFRGGMSGRERRALSRGRGAAERTDHGASRYRAGCRCDLCREGHRLYAAEYRERAAAPSFAGAGRLA